VNSASSAKPRDRRIAPAPVIASTGEQADRVAVASDDEAIAVVLNLVHPIGTGRFGGAGRDAGLDEAVGANRDNRVLPCRSVVFLPQQAASTPRPCLVIVSPPATSRSISPLTTVVVTVALVMPAGPQSVRVATQNSRRPGDAERLGLRRARRGKMRETSDWYEGGWGHASEASGSSEEKSKCSFHAVTWASTSIVTPEPARARARRYHRLRS
jgi:hypothetical protein